MKALSPQRLLQVSRLSRRDHFKLCCRADNLWSCAGPVRKAVVEAIAALSPFTARHLAVDGVKFREVKLLLRSVIAHLHQETELDTSREIAHTKARAKRIALMLGQQVWTIGDAHSSQQAANLAYPAMPARLPTTYIPAKPHLPQHPLPHPDDAKGIASLRSPPSDIFAFPPSSTAPVLRPTCLSISGDMLPTLNGPQPVALSRP